MVVTTHSPLKPLRELLRGYTQGLLIFTSSQCINCEHQGYILENVKLPDSIKLIEIDVDSDKGLLVKYGVSKVPTTVLIDADTLQGLSIRVGVVGRIELNKIMGVK
ncbi:thioredoxin-like protein [Shewanella phage vB_SspS_KASIA]|nr:thioredoxin-like protein [Shewanella phage vB_SspS_KASIA]